MNNALEIDRDRVTGLLNDAKIATEKDDIVSLLSQAEELLIHKHSQSLLGEFLGSFLDFHLDNSPQVKKYICKFIATTCRVADAILSVTNLKDIVGTLSYLTSDQNNNVLKSIITSSTSAYKKGFQVLCLDSASSEQDRQALWNIMNVLEKKIIEFLDHDNDGVRVHSYHFLETLIIIDSFPASSGPLYVGTRRGPKLTTEQEDI
ncbi:hypothetical protein AKO1_015520, partial [Acrasis kona]